MVTYMRSSEANEILVLGIVNNDVTNDTRVKRVAASAMAAGFCSQILGFASGEKTQIVEMGEVKITRVPVPLGTPSKVNSGANLVGVELLVRLKRKAISVLRKILVQIIDLLLNLPGVRAFLRRNSVNQFIDRTVRKVITRDFNTHYGAEILRIKPDLIHAHDFHMIGVAVEAAEKLKAAGHAVKVVYDAHELVAGLDHLEKSVQEKWLNHEEAYINRVDAVICVSDLQASRLQERYQLNLRPEVILNCPILETALGSSKTIRDDVGHSGALLVYHGKASRARGLEELVEALEFLNSETHIALVVDTSLPFVKDLEALAETINEGMGIKHKRLHLLPYVDASDLPRYLSSADIAVIPLRETGNHEVAMPNKLFEAVQAKLPVLTSERQALSEYVIDKGIGMVFADDNPKSLAQTVERMLAAQSHFVERYDEAFLKECSWDAQSEKLISFYCQVLGMKTMPVRSISLDEIRL